MSDAAGELCWALLRTEREVGRRRARDVSARWLLGVRVADAAVLLLLIVPWARRADGTRLPGLAVSSWLTTATVITIAIRQVVLAAVAAHADRQASRTVLAASVLGTLGVALAAVRAARDSAGLLVSALPPLLFAGAVALAGILTLLAGRQIGAAVDSVDLLGDLVRPSSDLVRHRLDVAFADATRRPPRLRPAALRHPPRTSAPAATPVVRRPGVARAAGGFGAAARIAIFGAAAALAGSAAEVLTASARPEVDHWDLVPGWSGLPVLVWVAGALSAVALLALARTAVRPAAGLAATLGLALGGFVAGGLALLGVATRLQVDGARPNLPGPAHWLALGAFAAATSAALLTVSALCEEVRERHRPPLTDLAAAQRRLAALRLA